MDQLLVMRAGKGCGSMLGTITRIDDERSIVEVPIFLKLREPELRHPFHERIPLRQKPGCVLRVRVMIEDMRHHPCRRYGVIRPLSRIFHPRMSKDIHLIMDHPSWSPINQLRRLCTSRYPGILHVIKHSDLQIPKPRLVRSPMVHLEVNVGVVIGAPGCGKGF